MKNELNRKKIGRIPIGFLAAFILVSAFTMPAMADDVFPDNHHIYVEMTNGARFNENGNNTHYFKFDGGGLNALHITDDYNQPNGQVTNSPNITGTFYIADTGGRGYDDDAILMIAVNDTESIPEGFTIRINASGYQWDPTGDGSQPSQEDITYIPGTVNENFTVLDFTGEGSQIWKPYTTADYPIYYAEDMGDTENTFRLMFIDLKSGILGGNTTYTSTLEHHGAVKVDYTIYNPPEYLVFNAYAYCNQSNQGQGVSWTNRVSEAGSSGWTVDL